MIASRPPERPGRNEAGRAGGAPRRPVVAAKDGLLGRPIASTDAADESIGPAEGVSLLGLDALASAAYGPEATLTALLAAGAVGLRALPAITAAVCVVMVIVCGSYWQTIGAYPHGGGSYSVARENLGPRAGLWAASALALDYVLNVAVAIAAGVAAAASALPALEHFRLPLCLGLLGVLMIVNLRGVRASGRAFGIPTFVFIGALVATIVMGALKPRSGSGAATGPPSGATGLGAWLAVRAFASGCTALTGVEAVSNGVPLFKAPAITNARRTHVAITVLLSVLLVGIALLCRRYGIAASAPGSPGYQSVLSALIAAVAGRGWFYFGAMAAIFVVLALSANTSFAAFPSLCSVLARDGFMPVRFAHRGPRLVYVPGILLLTGSAGILLLVFAGVTDRLIPLFVVGAFLAFTLSQLGMAARLWRARGPAARAASATNAVGAALTATVLAIVLASRMRQGAWIAVVVIPGAVAFLRWIRRGRDRIEQEIAAAAPLDIPDGKPPIVIVPLHRLDRASRKALAFALKISPDIHGFQLLTEAQDEAPDLSERWATMVEHPAAAAGRAPPKLTVIRSKYRDLAGPLVEHARRLAVLDPDREIAVLVPERVGRRWYHALLRSHRAARLRKALLASGPRRIVVIDAPWFLDR